MSAKHHFTGPPPSPTFLYSKTIIICTCLQLFIQFSAFGDDAAPNTPPANEWTVNNEGELAWLAMNQKGRLDPWFRFGWVTVKGRVLDSEGRPIAGAKVRGCPDADLTSERARKFPTRYAVSGSDGFYELTDLAPPDISDIAAYLKGRDPIHFSQDPFYLYVLAEAEGFRRGTKYAAHVPLITEDLLKPARRMEKIMTVLEAIRDGRGTPNLPELPLPASRSNTIAGIDIVLEKIKDEK